LNVISINWFEIDSESKKRYTAAGLEIVDEDGRYYIKKKE
jgi:hypothetical protein